MNNKEYKDIWVFAELEEGAVSQTVLELLAKSHDLKAKLGGTDKVTAVLLGSGVKEQVQTLWAYGAERVILVDDEGLCQYKHRVYTDALVKLCEKHLPSIFLFAASPMGRELAPRVMCRLGTGLTADAIDLDVDEDGTFVQTTPNFGGNILSHIAIPVARPQMCTVHPKVFAAMEPCADAAGELLTEEMEIISDEDYVILGREEKAFEGVRLDKAKVVVSGGFGLKEEEDMNMLRELASLIGGELGCSRPLCERGWFGHEKQIGQSGTTIAPELIVNIAISGSIQYMAGMENSKKILSINKDKAASIFDVSHYGAVADYRQLVPAIIEEIKKRKQ